MNLHLMVAAMKYNEADGISKKIFQQAASLSCEKGTSALLCFGDKCVLRLSFNDGILVGKEIITSGVNIQSGNLKSTKNEIVAINRLLVATEKCIINEKPSFIYIRHMIPQPKLLSVLLKAKKHKVRIGYEIPTYPYYKEQMNVSHNKVKTLVKLMLETFFWPLIYILINRLFVICCNSKAIHYKKMVSIRNGFSGEQNEFVKRDTNNLEMIGVGTIYPYHGYDKIIESMKKCNFRLANGGNIIFHIVGQSEEIDRLKSLVSENEKDHIIFHGVQYGNDLKKIYYSCNLGVGTMALELRNADIDTAIKNVEYFANDLPVLTSGSIFDVPCSTGFYMVQSETRDIDFDKVSFLIKAYYEDDNRELKMRELLHSFSWTQIMSYVIKKSQD